MGRALGRLVWIGIWIVVLGAVAYWGIPKIVDRTLGPQPPVPPVATPQAGTFSWIDKSTDLNPPAAWPCRTPIRFTVVTEFNPPGGTELIAEVMRDIQRRTDGMLTFVRAPDRAKWNGTFPVQGIAVGWDGEKWRWPASVDDVSGVGAPRFRLIRQLQYVRGMARVRLANTPRADRQGRTTVTHEIGHALGLGHVSAGTDSIMTPRSEGLTHFTRSDVTALKWAAAWACRHRTGIFGQSPTGRPGQYPVMPLRR